MDFSLKQALSTAIAILVCGMILFSFGGFISQIGEDSENGTVKEESFYVSNMNDSLQNRKAPQISVKNIHLTVGQEFNKNILLSYVKAIDSVDGDITSSVKVYGNVDISKAGSYEIKFVAENSAGLRTAYVKNVLVD